MRFGTEACAAKRGVGMEQVWDLGSLGCIQTFAADAEIKGIKSYLKLSHKNMIVAANNRRFQAFEFSYSNTPELTDDQGIVCAIYNEVIGGVTARIGSIFPALYPCVYACVRACVLNAQDRWLLRRGASETEGGTRDRLARCLLCMPRAHALPRGKSKRQEGRGS